MKDRMTPDELEKFIHRTLRSLPDRRAPATLEARVAAALEARAAIPWWHKSWTYWPQWVRALFVLFCGGLAALVVVAVKLMRNCSSAEQVAGFWRQAWTSLSRASLPWGPANSSSVQRARPLSGPSSSLSPRACT